MPDNNKDYDHFWCLTCHEKKGGRAQQFNSAEKIRGHLLTVHDIDPDVITAKVLETVHMDGIDFYETHRTLNMAGVKLEQVIHRVRPTFEVEEHSG